MRSFTAIIFLFCLSFSVKAQDRLFSQKYSFGFWLGSSAYIGDITPAYPNIYETLRPAGGIFSRINFNPRIAWKTSLNVATLIGDDHLSNNIYNQFRNLSFRTRVLDLSGQLEFNFFKYILNSDHNSATPYLLAGFSLFYFNPQAYYDGTWYNLQPLGTEGQQFPQYSGNEPYARVSWAFLYGGGIKLSIHKGFSMGFEAGYRSTFTDYIDDISTYYVDNDVIASGRDGGIAALLADRSRELAPEPIGLEGRQRGNSENFDHYLFMGINLALTIRKRRCPSPGNSIFEKW